MTELAAVSGYAVVVALTTLPVLSVIAVLLNSGKASRGWALTGGYAVGLVIVFAAASFGLDQVPLPRVRVRGVTEIAAGVLLLFVVVVLIVWRRRRARHPRHEAGHRPHHRAHALSVPRSALVGVQFAFHPENLALIFAAVTHVTDFDWPGRLATAVWFAVVGVSTVAIPSLTFAVAGERMRGRFAEFRGWIDTHGFLLTELLLGAVGVLLIAVGLSRVLSL